MSEHGYRSFKYSRWLVNRLPARLIYFATIRLVADVTSGAQPWRGAIPELPAMEAVQLYGDKHGCSNRG